MHLSPLLPLLAILTVVQSIEFVNPGAAGTDSDYSANPSFPYGSDLDIQWTPTSDTISLVMYQQTQNAAFEYVFAQKSGISSYNWDITTNKSLDVSRIFFFEIFIVGETSPAASSHYFNITGSAKSAASSSSSAIASSSSSAGTATLATSTKAPTTPATTAPAGGSLASGTSATSTHTPDDGGLSTGAKVGLGVGIPVAVIAGILAGWWFLGRKRKSKKQAELQQAQSQPAMSDYYGSGEMQHSQSQYARSELPPSQPSMQEYYKPGTQDDVRYHHGPAAMTNPHELDAPQSHPAELPHEQYR